MDVIIAVASLVVWVVAIIGIPMAFFGLSGAFNDHCMNKFGHRFITFASCLIAAVASPSLYFGWIWYTDGGDTENGLALMGIGAVIALSLCLYNIKRSNITYGLLGSAIVLTIFGVLALIGVIFYLIIVVAFIFILFNSKPVYVINK